MFDSNSLLEKLRSGVSADALAQELADALNKANDAFAEEQEKEAQEKARKTEKTLALQSILDLYTEWFSNYYGPIEKLKAEDVISLLDSFDSVKVSVKELPVTVDSIFEKFFKDFGI